MKDPLQPKIKKICEIDVNNPRNKHQSKPSGVKLRKQNAKPKSKIKDLSELMLMIQNKIAESKIKDLSKLMLMIQNNNTNWSKIRITKTKIGQNQK